MTQTASVQGNPRPASPSQTSACVLASDSHVAQTEVVPDSEEAQARHCCSRVSITTRLSRLFALMVFLLLSSIGGWLYFVLEYKLEMRDQEELIHHVHGMRIYLHELPSQVDLAGINQRWGNVLSSERHMVHLVVADEKGHVLYRSMKDGPDGASLVKRADNRWDDPSSSWIWVQDENNSYRVVSAWAHLGNSPNAQRVLIGLCLSTRDNKQIMHEYGFLLLLTVLLGTVITGGITAWLTQRRLRPLLEITQSASEITANRLDRRVPIYDDHKEFYELAIAFNGMLSRLDEAFQKQSDLSSDLAHELRSPINGLQLQAQVALSKPRTVEEYQEILNSSVEGYQILSRLIEGMLFLARADNAEAVLRKESLELREQVECVSEFYQMLAEDSGLSVEITGEAQVEADKALVRRALSNLLANAIQHTPKGGVIRIEVAQNREVKNREESASVSVINPGQGIDAEHLPRLFDRFYRIDKARTPDQGGTGLGLAIVRSIMRLHAGDIKVCSTIGETTRFTLIFPKHSPVKS